MRKIEDVLGDDESKTRLQYLQAIRFGWRLDGVGDIRTLPL